MKVFAVKCIRLILSESNKLEFFILLSLLYIFSAILIDEYVMHDELYYRSFGNHLSLSVIDELISFINQWQWVGYIGIPIILSVKFLLVGTFISMGSIVAGHNLTFSRIFAIAMVAEVVYLTANLITTGNILFSEFHTLEDINTNLLSLASLVSEQETAPYFYIPLQSISLFLLMYIFFLSWCYKIVTGYPLSHSFVLILATCGTAFLMWLILIMYLLISYA